jgi:hypothetical protein
MRREDSAQDFGIALEASCGDRLVDRERAGRK